MGFTNFKEIAVSTLRILKPSTLLSKLRESVLVDGVQFFILFISKKIFFVLLLLGHELSMYLEKFSSLVA